MLHINQTFMTDETTVVEDSTLNLAEETTEETTSQTPEQEDELTPQAIAFKNQRAEENRKKREALEKVPKLEAELEKQKFFRKSPEAEEFEAEIDDFRAKNPTIWLEQAFRYVLADKDPARLAEIMDSGAYAQRNQWKTAPAVGDKSFSEQIGEQNLNDMASMKAAAEKEFAKMMG